MHHPLTGDSFLLMLDELKDDEVLRRMADSCPVLNSELF
ncbi:hypothetical protein SAMN04488004_12716 [Loktanella salsilacus]|jgi:hypothetical protein|uniref:Uncharacterized protein n=1 Tax=Loktanella salsilacus TaxID=195913 RepID=A0A1I4IM91_9RHOB|nr:hypothetical protein SAMN04488004_12716 [Loktanella salsilacus]